MKIFKHIEEMRIFCKKVRQKQKTIALVATMGALHKGHLALVEKANKLSDVVIVSIFVNPAQFGKHEDLNTYPRNLKKDITLLKTYQVEALFTPSVKDIYPLADGFYMKAPTLAERFCGNSRPDFFHGIALIMSKLFIIIAPNISLFGEKDYQQLHIIKTLVHDLHFDIDIVAVPTQREKDGLAMSSRNQYLNAKERAIAPKLYQILTEARRKLKCGEDLNMIKKEALVALKLNFKCDYFEILKQDSLSNCGGNYRMNCDKIVIMVAVILGKTRLIDNIKV